MVEANLDPDQAAELEVHTTDHIGKGDFMLWNATEGRPALVAAGLSAREVPATP